MAETPVKRGRGRPRKNQVAEPEVVDTPVKQRKMPRLSVKSWPKVLVTLVVIGVIAFLGWQYLDAKRDVKRLSDPKNAAQIANDEVIAKVKKIALVPDNEKPTVADVSDASKLQGQPLFDQVQNGDKVLLFTQARREVVYRPSTNQIITIVTLPQESADTTQQ